MFEEIRLTCSRFDHTIFYYINTLTILIIGVYVDNCSIFASSLELTNTFVIKIEEKVEVEYLGDITFNLGFKLTCDRKARTITIKQTGYISTLLEHFGLTDTQSVSIPLDPGEKLLPLSDMMKHEIHVSALYYELVGALLYLSNGTRPEITFIVTQLT